jgi:streptogramin lyase
MIPQRWQRSILGIRSGEGRRGPAARMGRPRRPAVEAMESRQLLSTVAEFPTPTAASGPVGIVTGPDGNLWFTETNASKIGTINPTTHVATDFPTPTAASAPEGITVGSDGNLWFTELGAGKIGTINPTTHAITEFAIPTTGSAPYRIAAGSDGNLWFTEYGGNKIGEINPTTHAISEFPIPTANSGPFGIAAGADGNLWFTEQVGNKIGEINPTTHVLSEFTIPTTAAQPFDIAAGSDGALWFAEGNGNKIGSIDPTTHAIVETTLATGSFPIGISSGPDGNLWFTEFGTNKIGSINPVTRGVTETPVLTPNSLLQGITSGPDGNLWFAEANASKIGVLTPSLSLVATTEPPSFVMSSSPFSLTVNVDYQSGVLDTGFNGNVTVALVNPNANGATLGGTLTVAAKDGVATFTGLTLNQLGTGYRITAFTDPLTTTLTTPITVAVPPTIVTEKVIFAGKGRHKRVVGYELDFSTAMDPTRAASVVNYTLSQFQRRGGQLVSSPVTFMAAYDATAHDVTLTLVGKPKFVKGGKLVVVAQPPGGLTSAAGAPLDGGNQGTFGDNGTFVIARKGNGISR